MNDYPKTRRALDILKSGDLAVNRDRFFSQLGVFRRVCSTWNPAAKLMSTDDLRARFDDHVADSISLLPFVNRLFDSGYEHVDIGSGAGFPAVPIAIIHPGSKIMLVERSQKKATYLRFVIQELSLHATRVINADIASVQPEEHPTVYTARAVEKPESIDRVIAKRLRETDFFLAQRAAPPKLTSEDFKTVEVDDVFSASRLRRSRLYIVSRNDPAKWPAKFHVEPTWPSPPR